MTTPTQWIALLNPELHWKTTYPEIARIVREYLDKADPKDPDASMSTAQLVEALFPEQLARGPGITARKKLFKVLFALSTYGLQDYCHRAEPVRGRYGTDRPFRWHANRKPVAACPHCGGVL